MRASVSAFMRKIPRIIVHFPLSSIKAAVKKLTWCQMLDGPDVHEFEQEFKKYIGVKHAFATANGKTGLYLALKALKAQPGDEIIIPSYTVWDVPAIIIAMGLKPVFIDITASSFNLDIDTIPSVITPKTRFILATHLYGYPCRINDIQAIADRYNLKVIEDCAQSLGAEYEGRKTGSFGDVSYFSFGTLKNLNTFGGGMVITDCDEAAQIIRSEIKKLLYPSKSYLLKNLLISCFMSLSTSLTFFSCFVFPVIHIAGDFADKIVKNILSVEPDEKVTANYLKNNLKRFTNIQAAAGLDQLKDIDKHNSHRISNSDILTKKLAQSDPRIKLHKIVQGTKPIFLNYVIQVPEELRVPIIKKVRARGIDIGYGFLSHCAGSPSFSEFQRDCPNSDKLTRTNLYLPVQPPLNASDMSRLADELINAVNDLKQSETV